MTALCSASVECSSELQLRLSGQLDYSEREATGWEASTCHCSMAAERRLGPRETTRTRATRLPVRVEQSPVSLKELEAHVGCMVVDRPATRSVSAVVLITPKSALGNMGVERRMG